MLILALDTSCDETSAAVTYGERVLSNVIVSQVEAHRKFGGVEPLVAKREHQKLIGSVVESALDQARVKAADIKAVAVTIGPGLALALEVGVGKAKELVRTYKKPLIAVDHMEGHLLSAFARDAEGRFGVDEPEFPAIGLLVSGGHTELVLMKDFGDYRLLGETLDDAAGECFDKVARILGLGYPGGPIISKLARGGNPAAFDFPIPMGKSGDLDFSFSGLKTACLYKRREVGEMSLKQIADFCASFERVAIEALVIKLVSACYQFQPRMILLGGGVVASRYLQEVVRKEASRLGVPVCIPYSPQLLTDNAAMIGIAAFYKMKQGKLVENPDEVERIPNLALSGVL